MKGEDERNELEESEGEREGKEGWSREEGMRGEKERKDITRKIDR